MLLIDAEGNYEGKYASADRFMRALRARVGDEFPISLAAFPYVDYHPSFPYSVFFGPGGATYNQPQMYWRAIETSVRAVYEHTYLFNRLWGTPVYPLGQTYGGAGRKEIRLFRRFGASYGGLQPSWWDWQETTPQGWKALGADNLGPVAAYRPITSHPLLKKGSGGDLVVWAQEHLRAAGEQVPVTVSTARSPALPSATSRPPTVSRSTARSAPPPGNRCSATNRSAGSGAAARCSATGPAPCSAARSPPAARYRPPCPPRHTRSIPAPGPRTRPRSLR